MPHRDNRYYTTHIIYDIEHTIIPDPDAPAIMRADEFTTTRRTRLIG